MQRYALSLPEDFQFMYLESTDEVRLFNIQYTCWLHYIILFILPTHKMARIKLPYDWLSKQTRWVGLPRMGLLAVYSVWKKMVSCVPYNESCIDNWPSLFIQDGWILTYNHGQCNLMNCIIMSYYWSLNKVQVFLLKTCHWCPSPPNTMLKIRRNCRW